tara:strand:+ start:137 stop:580 length:444 start_codon:yes stop_codon:yes gene_type:complete
MDQTEYQKQYYIKNRRRKLINRWKKQGLLSNDYNFIFDKYSESSNCELCNVSFINITKCMEHSHITGKFRHICCISCNNNMKDRKTPLQNITGHKNIIIKTDKRSNKTIIRYMYKKTIYGKTYSKTFKFKKDALCYKFICLLKMKLN